MIKLRVNIKIVILFFTDKYYLTCNTTNHFVSVRFEKIHAKKLYTSLKFKAHKCIDYKSD